MKNEKIVAEWIEYAKMDEMTAEKAFELFRPKPFAIICFHCQQAAEKILKVLSVFYGEEPEKTHDLLSIAKTLKKWTNIPENVVFAAADLTKYAAKTRYPQSADIDEPLTKKALSDMKIVVEWAKCVLQSGKNHCAE